MDYSAESSLAFRRELAALLTKYQVVLAPTTVQQPNGYEVMEVGTVWNPNDGDHGEAWAYEIHKDPKGRRQR